jgi:AcrR family transcriptional regulator
MTTITRRTGRPAEDAVARRAEIYRRARPLLEEFGYRQVRVKQLARACYMSPAALYHYFPTKRDLVLYPLSAPDRNGRCELLRRRLAGETDPLRCLRAWVDFVLEEREGVILALRLAPEAVTAGTLSRPGGDIGMSLDETAAFVVSFVDNITHEQADDLVRELFGVIMAPALTGLPVPRDVAAAHALRLLRRHLVPQPFSAVRFDAAFA